MKRITVFWMFMIALAFAPMQVLAINISDSKAEAKGKENKSVQTPNPPKPEPTKAPCSAKPTPQDEKSNEVEVAKPDLVEEKARIIPSAINKPTATMELETYKVRVDNQLNLEGLIDAAKIDWVHWYVTVENFSPLKPSGEPAAEIEVMLLKLDGNLNNISWLHDREFTARRIRPIDIRELMALGAQYPDLQKKFWVVALGSRFETRPYHSYPFIAIHGRERILNLTEDTIRNNPPNEWAEGLRFAVVRIRKQ